MANTLLTSDIIARTALANLYETTVMAPLVHRDYSPEFGAKVGDTITVRKPTTFEAEEYVRANGITVQTATETSVPIVLNHFADVSFAVTSEEMTLEIQDFNEQLLNPAMEAIAQKIDRDILSLRDDVTQAVGFPNGTAALWNDPKVIVDAGRVLTQANVPFSERRAVTGPITAAEWLKDDLLHRADKSGSTSGLREAAIGRLFGFDTYQTQNISTEQESDASGQEVGVAFHRTAFALVTRPLELPRGAANASIANYKGFALRVVIAYDNDQKQDVVSIDTLYGTKTLDANRAVLIVSDES